MYKKKNKKRRSKKKVNVKCCIFSLSIDMLVGIIDHFFMSLVWINVKM